MKKSILLLALVLPLIVKGQPKTYHTDFEFFWKTIDENYCYMEKKGVDWESVKTKYGTMADTVSTRSSFITLLEKALYELYDHHAGLKTRNAGSRRLVPSGTDIWAEYFNGRAVVTEVRKGYGAERVGVRAGMEILSVNDVPVEKAISNFLGSVINDRSKSFALRLVLAGDHSAKRKFTLKSGSVIKDYYPDEQGLELEDNKSTAMVESARFGNIGYIKVRNYLFDNQMIQKFDSTLDRLLSSSALIIDLRETPSGGNTTVARALLGRFITKDQFYQTHELYVEQRETGIKRSWTEIVSPRGKTFKNPVVILADHWTGSVGEGITIAFDGMHRARVIGTPLAGLNGAVESFELPYSKIGFNIPTERLFHVNGVPREEYRPSLLVDVSKQSAADDLMLDAAIRYIEGLDRRTTAQK